MFANKREDFGGVRAVAMDAEGIAVMSEFVGLIGGFARVGDDGVGV